MSRRTLRSVIVAALMSLPALASTACSSTAATTAYIPQTGVLVRSESLTTGLGCGTATGQIWKYVAVAIDASGYAAAAGTYDCFADGVLVNLDSAAVGSGATPTFTVKVYAFDQVDFNAAATALATAVARPNTTGGQFDGPSFATLGATYTTTCTATEEANIQVVAVCDKLTAK